MESRAGFLDGTVMVSKGFGFTQTSGRRLHKCLQGVSSCLVRESGRAVRQHLGLVAGAVLVSGDGGAGLGDGCIGPGMEGYTVLQMKGVLSEMRGGLILEVDDMMVPGQSVWCPVGRGCICLMDGG